MTPDVIINAVCQVYEVSALALRGPSRRQWIVEARMAAIVLLRESGMSLHNCGRVLRRDHSSILHLEIKAVTQANAPQYAARLARVRDRLQVTA